MRIKEEDAEHRISVLEDLIHKVRILFYLVVLLSIVCWENDTVLCYLSLRDIVLCDVRCSVVQYSTASRYTVLRYTVQ